MTISSPGRHVAVLLAAIVGLSLLGATPAHAAKRTFTDARGDVRTFTITEEDLLSEEVPPSAPSTTPVGDVLSTTIDHRKRQVVVTTRFASIRRDSGAMAQFRFQGSNQQRRIASVTNMGRARGHSDLVRESTGRQVCAKAVAHRIDYRANTLRLAFPARCIGNPKQLRMGAITLRFTTPDGETVQVFYDDAFRTGGEVDVIGGYTPFVRRG